MQRNVITAVAVSIAARWMHGREPVSYTHLVEQMGDPVEIYLHPKTPFVAQFIGKSSIIEEYGKLKGFDSIGPDTRAIIRPEFVEIKSPKDVTEQSSIYEQAAVEQSIFRGNYFEVLLNIKGITIRTNSRCV